VSKLSTLRRRWRKEPDFRAEYDALREEFALAAALIDARAHAALTQAEVARRMATTQAYVAKMEGGRINPSVRTLERFAAATGTRLKITFEPEDAAARERHPVHA
jgi:transcriptional regulator with XRE-family HTH domain